ncbi:MAG TPA: YafY family protein [Sediminibacterium sp.]|nr:YafY family protein [Sediminibacterium sp.]
MNRIDRVTAILIHLQSRRVVKAQDIADRFGISLRTVYRDIHTLSEAGIPILGEAGVGYSIMEGYRLPPVMFTREEATALLTAEKLVEKLTDKNTNRIYSEAMLKIRSVLRVSERDHLESLEAHIAVIDSPYIQNTGHETAYLQQILKAIAEKRALNIDYFAEHSQQQTNRNIEPVGIFFMGRNWYLIAWCCLRNDYRTFRVDHIRFLSVTEVRFDKDHPALQSFLNRVSREKDLTKVIIRVDKKILRFMGDQKYYNGFVSQKDLGDRMEMIFLTASLEGFSRWYLYLGEWADIITPVSLTEKVKQHLASLSQKLDTGKNPGNTFSC